jgi:hypothetical protein
MFKAENKILESGALFLFSTSRGKTLTYSLRETIDFNLAKINLTS